MLLQNKLLIIFDDFFWCRALTMLFSFRCVTHLYVLNFNQQLAIRYSKFNSYRCKELKLLLSRLSFLVSRSIMNRFTIARNKNPVHVFFHNAFLQEHLLIAEQLNLFVLL